MKQHEVSTALAGLAGLAGLLGCLGSLGRPLWRHREVPTIKETRKTFSPSNKHLFVVLRWDNIYITNKINDKQIYVL